LLTVAFVVRQVSMAETRTTSTKAVEKRTTPNESDDLLRGVVEELAALRVIVEGSAHSTGAEFFQTLVRHLAHPNIQ
jgi:hypothetical protein